MRRLGTLAAFAAAAAITVGFSSTDTRRIVYVRNDSGMSNAKIQAALPSFQKALDRDFGPAWDVSARLVFIGHNPAPRGSWRITLVDTPNCVMCAGFHEWKGYARAEVGKDGGWRLTFTHELFEMLVDPVIQADGSNGRMIATSDGAYLVEVGDPVETETYKIAGVTISDFVTPAWYGIGDGRYDFLGRCDHAFQVLPGGYAWKIAGTWTPL